MGEFAELILRSGKSAIELGFFVLLPVMIVMLTIMRLLEARNILDRLVAIAAPLLRPFGIPGLGVFAMIQVLFVGFAGPLATLTMMDKSGISRRHIATTLAMVLSMAQANVVFPMAAVGLDAGMTMLISALAGILGAAATNYIFARNLPDTDEFPEPVPKHPLAEDTKGVLAVINRAGKEAFNITVGALPMLVLALLMVNILRSAGLIQGLAELLEPVFAWFDLSSNLLLPIITKMIAGGTAVMGVMVEFLNEGLISKDDMNRMAGLLISPFDVAGVAILISAGPRVASVLKPAAYGAMVAILIRALVHGLIY